MLDAGKIRITSFKIEYPETSIQHLIQNRSTWCYPYFLPQKAQK
jgi:hypothetical protein